MLKELKELVLEANLALPGMGLVKFTWGNASARDPQTGHVVIKPSGVPYEKMTSGDMVVLDMTGQIVEGSLRPSSDTPTHLALYQAFPGLGSIVHTHSPEATAWAQAGLDIPPYGTTHADFCAGPIPCARALTREEINGAYEHNTGQVMIETFHLRGLDPGQVPAMLCWSHGAFTWGRNVREAVMNAGILEEVARLARLTKLLNPSCPAADPSLLDRHFSRKHGDTAYYGQKS